MRTRYLVFGVLLLAFTACQTGDLDMLRLQEVILQYNRVLTDGYRTMNMNPLQGVATLEQAKKAYYHMAALAEANTRMLSDVKKITFDDASFPRAGEALVSTTEVWDFVHVDSESGKPYYEQRDIVYHVAYRLINKGETWLVASVAASSEKQGRADKPHPRFYRPAKEKAESER